MQDFQLILVYGTPCMTANRIVIEYYNELVAIADKRRREGTGHDAGNAGTQLTAEFARRLMELPASTLAAVRQQDESTESMVLNGGAHAMADAALRTGDSSYVILGLALLAAENAAGDKRHTLVMLCVLNDAATRCRSSLDAAFETVRFMALPQFERMVDEYLTRENRSLATMGYAIDDTPDGPVYDSIDRIARRSRRIQRQSRHSQE
jgi:hypothetical protein